ncbi:DUF1127 domain-containing protein [Pseudooceanicola sp.]|uniref:DUF1127 domain-containing protein n=1 Tax=Pseudooceanicola sp. TaxID=1914328 RepID=UPI0026284E85|nr:DUF1127 domain-containing protein [Pseudooceanicola sp.]MDF1854397.1 DUF1127 domain-containing protein [Pseudooceanicola sp.]
MTMLTDTHAGATHSSGLFSRVIATISTRLHNYAAYRRNLAELAVLSDRDLKDIGANRSMIRSMAHEAAYRPV